VNDTELAEKHVRFYVVARDKAEHTWLAYNGEPWQKERLRRAYEFADRVLLGWERKLERARARQPLQRTEKPVKKIVQELKIENRSTADGAPDGGHYEAPGLVIDWQRGALVGPNGEELEPSGLFLETLVRAGIARLTYYQSTKFNCRDNAVALTHLETALLWLGKRAAEREERGVLGTHTT
jgi:hypothetical protein